VPCRRFLSIHNLESAFAKTRPQALRAACRLLLFGVVMKDFSEATFVPEMVHAMTEALDASVATLPHPVSSTQVNLLAESILRTAQSGERDPAILQRMALLELTITPRG
jgi:hypothetical protein